MPQKVLHPSAEAIPGATWIPPGPIPRALRAFGKFPNLDQWRPADLLLVASITPDAAVPQIVNAQARGGYAPEDARWQHAAVYIGEGCSQLYADAYSRVTGRLVTPPVAGIPTPAALSGSAAFEDVDLTWATIPH
jgi:hypothetical protein